MNAELFFETQALLGEGAIWDSFLNKLLWVDIEGKSLNMLNVETLENKVFAMPKRIGTVVSINMQKVLVALEDGIATVDIEEGTLEYQRNTNIHLAHNSRFNDGKCDPVGRFWVGTLSMSGIERVSSLYCMDQEFSLTTKIEGVSISNGIAWDAKRCVMYYIDTPTGTIVEYDYDEKIGAISNSREVIKIDSQMGFPDGMTIDEEGMLWVALWDGFGVIRIDPKSGSIVEKIDVQAPKVTSCAFGGQDFTTLFITTARVEMSDEELEKYPLSGSIFSIETGVKGVKSYSFKQ
ncbi:MAG: SMP-30/gluconolactonase/LRE family protein [Pedobacter sp.]|nr:MAG: SMP-30/gluconolactonase/LRE family protein [Pedobacter sp.]